MKGTSGHIISEQFEACIIAGAIGDAWGAAYENDMPAKDDTTFYWGKKPTVSREWIITDDTQLTLATCEVLVTHSFDPALLAQKLLQVYKAAQLRGAGASTIKAMRDLDSGLHWRQAGRSGEFAAGNGAAMRIAPLAFFSSVSRANVRDACMITHNNDEAYTGALAVFLVLREILTQKKSGSKDLLRKVITALPDTQVRDRLMEIAAKKNSTIQEIAGLYGTNGYVVNSVPFAIFSGLQAMNMGLAEVLEQVISCGGDTDTNASIAGQIGGALLGPEKIPGHLKNRLADLPEYGQIIDTIKKVTTRLESQPGF
ncbi:MAG: ADP-ribosylglycohydrolase family protein [Chitinophagaceae bacterium]|nr:ADP-ribosylglycohydrolase family protein [Chitinophagaceae bacterium]